MAEICYLSESEAVNRMNSLASEKTPFVFVIDFTKTCSIVIPLTELDERILSYDFTGNAEVRKLNSTFRKDYFNKYPVDFVSFEGAFQRVMAEIEYGNSFLLNLTFETPLKTNLSLRDIYNHSKAKYKLLLADQFVCFSPETFVKIKGNKIYSFPMKGTIDATLPDAENMILRDEKEKAEHYTIVDLIRNDLSMVSKQVKVNKFRFIDRLQTNFGDILQVSSEIEGTLPDNFHKILGEIIFKLLPAGSVTGAPKEKTISIIEEFECHKRGFYTGICGLFDGKDLDSAVLIRFIEQRGNDLFFKSGGGITFMSEAISEYNEMIKKVYVPFS